MKSGVTAVLLPGFGVLLFLIGVLGVGSIRRANEVYDQLTRAQRAYEEVDEATRPSRDEYQLSGAPVEACDAIAGCSRSSVRSRLKSNGFRVWRICAFLNLSFAWIAVMGGDGEMATALAVTACFFQLLAMEDKS